MAYSAATVVAVATVSGVVAIDAVVTVEEQEPRLVLEEAIAMGLYYLF